MFAASSAPPSTRWTSERRESPGQQRGAPWARVEVLPGRRRRVARRRHQFDNTVLRAARLTDDRDLDSALRGTLCHRDRIQVGRRGLGDGLLERGVSTAGHAEIHGTLRRERHFGAVLLFIAHHVKDLQRFDGRGQLETRRPIEVPDGAHRPIALKEISVDARTGSERPPVGRPLDERRAGVQGRQARAGDIVLVEHGKAIGRAGLGREPEVLGNACRAADDDVAHEKRGRVRRPGRACNNLFEPAYGARRRKNFVPSDATLV